MLSLDAPDSASQILHDKAVQPIATIKSRLQKKEIGLGIIAANGIILVAAVLFLLWGLSRGNDSPTQASVILIEVSVPQEISLTEYSSGTAENGSLLEMSGGTASLAFREGYLEAIDLPIYSSGQILASFSDASAGIYLERDSAGQSTLRFPLLSSQGSMPLTVTGIVKAIQPQAQGSKTRISLGQMEAAAEIAIEQIPDDGLPTIAKVQLLFELHRLPQDARLTVSRIDELDISTSSSIGSALDETKGPWTAVMAIEAKPTNLDNGDDIGEASLYVTLPSSMDQRSLESLIVVHVDDRGRAERLDSETVSTAKGETIVRFISPGGLSIFAVMISIGGLDAITLPTVTSAAIPTTASPPTPTATLTALPRPTPTPTGVATASATPTATFTLLPSPTTTATFTPLPSPTTTATFTPLPSPTPTISPSQTAVVTLVPSAVPTPTSTPSPTPTQAPSPTPTSQPTSIPIPTSTPTTVPIPVPDEHYAAIVHTQDPTIQQRILDILGTRWFLDGTSNVDVIPNGHEKLIPILSLPGPTSQVIQDIAQQAPGSVWYIVGEPNRRAGYGASDIVVQLHDLYMEIKAADPTAKITSPSILNWEFTCIGCSGYQKGSEWLDQFRAAYLTQYGQEPPIDIWAIDIYPLDWWNLPTVDHQIIIDQVNDMRQYLDAVGHHDDPIWITELGLHWGYDSMIFAGAEGYDDSCGGLPMPVGTYQTQEVINYLGMVFDWLDANADSKNIEKWFLFSTYRDITVCSSDGYAGLTLFNSPEIGANLTPVGEFFRDRVLGVSQ